MREPDVFPKGSLAVVAVPLGNPADITARALEVLKAADLIVAEDTRSALRLLAAHGISRPLVSYHDWNEASRARTLMEKLSQGQRIALVSEAGTPGISDPGFDLVRAARQNGLRVFPVPGPSALVAFLSVSGLPTDAFGFHGFPPKTSAKRRAYFQKLAGREETLVFYESPHRICAALDDALAVFGDREAALGREMTKTYEEFFYGPLSEILGRLKESERVRGEICWGVRGVGRDAPAAPPATEDDLSARLDEALATGAPAKTLAKELSKGLGMSAKEVYTLLEQRKRP